MSPLTAFVDIRMPPGLDGIQTIKEIWKIAPDIQTVICTAFSDYSWEQTISELGTNDNLLILKKPFDSAAVRQLACALTKKWHLLQTIGEQTQLLETRVTERTNSLQLSHSLTRATLDSSLDGIIAIDKCGKIVDYNEQFLEMWQIPKDLLTSYQDCFKIIVDQVTNPDEFLKIAADISSGADEVSIKTVNTKDGRILEKYSHPQKLNGETIGRIWSFRDITSRVGLEGKLEYQATHDALTNLPNRTLLKDRLQSAIYCANRMDNLVGVLVLDLDRFKVVNDSLGHEAGDELLKAVAKRLEAVVRSCDTISRIGGDEFIAVIGESKNEKAITYVANKILDIFNEPFTIAERVIYATTSIGIGVYPNDGITVDDLIRNASLAMYVAKRSGHNQFHFFTNELNQNVTDRLASEQEMREAIANNEFSLLYQPQLNLATNMVESVEALVRWNHPEKGMISPINFIPFAEESGLIVQLGQWVMKTACIQCKEWNDKGTSKIRVGVNVATAQLKQHDFVQTVKTILDESGLEPQYLEIEITENVLFSEGDILSTINELKELGLQIALDDFGSGYSCLSYLKKINVDRVKIDQSFIQNIDLDGTDEVIIQAIIDMAQSLNMEVLAEGVETQNQLDFIKSKNCHSMQGYHFGVPMTGADFEKFIAEQKPVETPSSA